MKKIGFISFILLCCYFTFITPAQADKTSQEVEFYEEVEREVMLENIDNVDILDSDIYTTNGEFYYLRYNIKKKGKLISYWEREDDLYLLYFDNNYYLEQLDLKNGYVKVIKFDNKIADMKIKDDYIYLVGSLNGDAIIYRYNMDLTLYNMYTFGGEQYEEFCKVYFIDDAIYLFGLKNGISHHSPFLNVGNSLDIKSFIIKIDKDYTIKNSFYINEHTELEKFKNIIIENQEIYFIIESNHCNYYHYTLDKNLQIKERFSISVNQDISHIFLVNSYNIKNEKIYVYIANHSLYYGVFTNQFVHTFKISDEVDNLNYSFIRNGILELFCTEKQKVIQYKVSMYYISYINEKIVYYKDSTYLDTNHFFASSYFEPLVFNYDYEKNSQITLNKSGMFEAFYYAKKADGSYLRIVTPYLIQPYLNIINEGMYQKGYQLEFSDNLYLNDKKVYNGEILNLIGENKITHEVNHMKKDYIIYVEEKYYKQMDLNWIKSHIVQNLDDRYVYNILLSYDKEVKQVIVNDEIWPFNKVGKMIMLEFYSHKVGIEKYNIDYIEFMDWSIYTIQEQVCIKTKKSLPIIDIYYQEDFIQYNIVDDDQSINDILIKYYLNDKTVIVDRLHLENSKIKINSNVTKIEVVLQCENGTTDLYEQILFEIEATTKSKEKSFFNIDIQYSDNKINEILIKDFNVKNIDLLSAKIQDVIFTDALVDNRNKVVIYISFILTSIIVIVSTIILVIKKKS